MLFVNINEHHYLCNIPLYKIYKPKIYMTIIKRIDDLMSEMMALRNKLNENIQDGGKHANRQKKYKKLLNVSRFIIFAAKF